MTDSNLPSDPLWPRASSWLAAGDTPEPITCDLGLLGVGAFRSSISPTGAHSTPAAVRAALARYSTWSTSQRIDVSELCALDFGDVHDPDGEEGEERTAAAASLAARRCRLLIAVGGDNSITYPVACGIFGGDGVGLEKCGLITVDAHHDLRDGVSNGSPVRRLVEAGLPGDRVVQIGIADFANSAEYSARARDFGITVITREDLRRDPLAEVVSRALAIAGEGERPIYVDLDADVCDRAVVPGCPASAPGGISADELRRLAFLLARSHRVRAIDVAEVDATADAPDGRTVRLAALLILEAAAGLAAR